MKHVVRSLLLALPLAACGAAEPVHPPAVLEESAAVSYPVELWDQGVEGETHLMVRVSPLGDADSVFIHQSSGYPALDSAAVTAVRTMRFRPGRRGDERVVAWVRLPVRFTHERAAALGTPEPSLP